MNKKEFAKKALHILLHEQSNFESVTKNRIQTFYKHRKIGTVWNLCILQK